MQKTPMLAAVLNIIPGVGYIYLDKKRPIGWLFLCGIGIGIVSTVLPTAIPDTTQLKSGDYVSLLSMLTLIFAIMIDAHREATRINGNASIKLRALPAKTENKVYVVQARSAKQHKKGLIAASIGGMLGIALSTVLWAAFYYNLAALSLFLMTLFGGLLYKRFAGSYPYGLQAYQLLYLFMGMAVLGALIGFYTDAIRWYKDETGIAYENSRFTWRFIRYYLVSVTDPTMWTVYTGQGVAGAIAGSIGALPILRNLRLGSEPKATSNTGAASQRMHSKDEWLI